MKIIMKKNLNLQKSIKVNAVLNILKKTCNIIFPFIVFPYVSRILGPESYGKYSFAYSIISYFILTTMLGINAYGVREGSRLRDDKQKFKEFSDEITTINFLTFLLSFSILLICIFFIPIFQNYKELLMILAISLPCNFLGREWINTVYEDYFYITVRYILVQLVGIILIFLFVKTDADYYLYTAISAFMISFGFLLNLFYTKKYAIIGLNKKVKLNKHLKPIIILFGAQLAVSLYVQSDITMLGIFRTEREVGVYTIASKIYVLIKGMINAAVMVTTPRLIFYLGKDRSEDYNDFLNKMRSYLAIFTFPCLIGVFFLSKEILYIVGGTDYLDGSNSLSILGISLVFAIYSSFYSSSVLIPNRREKEYFKITILAATVNVILNLLLLPLVGMVGAAITTLVSEIVVLIFTKRISKDYMILITNKRDVMTIIISCVWVICVCVLIPKVIVNIFVNVAVCIITSALGYFIILYITRNSVVTEAVNSVKEKMG